MSQDPQSQKSNYQIRSMKKDLESGKSESAPSNVPIEFDSPKKDDEPQKINMSEPKKENRELPPLPPKPRPLPKKGEFLSPRAEQKAPAPIGLNTEKKRVNEKLKNPRELPSKPPRRGGGKKRLVLLSVLAIVIVLFIFGEIWWFFIKAEPEPATTPEDFLPAPEENLPEPEEEPDIVTPEIPSPLLTYNNTYREISLDNISSVEFKNKINNLIDASFLKNSITRLVLIYNGNQNKEVVDLAELISLLGLRIPQEITNNLTGNYDLFYYPENSFDRSTCQEVNSTITNCYGGRLGLALETNSSTEINGILRSWESAMATDLEPLILAETNVTNGAFLNASYQGVPIRYRNFPINTATIDYILERNTLVITTSKTSMYSAINSLK